MNILHTIENLIHDLGEKDNLPIKWGILIVFALLVASLFPSGEAIESNYRIGVVWAENDLYAPFSFPIYKDEHLYQRERTDAAAAVFRVFAEDVSAAKRSIDSVQHFFHDLETAADAYLALQRRQRNATTPAFTVEMKLLPVAFTATEWKTITALRQADLSNSSTRLSLRRLQRDALLVMNELFVRGILDQRKDFFDSQTKLAIRKKTTEQILPVTGFYDLTELGLKVQQTFLSGYRRDNDTVTAATKIVLSFVTPNILFQKEQTDKEIAVAMDQIPRTLGVVQENERIIARRERITEDVKRKLDSLRKSKAERGADINSVTTYIGKFLHILAVFSLFGIYLYLFRKRIFRNNATLLLIALIMLLTAGQAYITTLITIDAPVEFLIMVPAASMLLAIIFDSRIAFYGTVAAAFMVAGIRSNDYTVALQSLLAGSLAVYTVRDIKHRTQIFRSIIFVFIGYAVAILALSLERYEHVQMMLSQLLFASVNAVFSPVLTYGLLIFFERVFHVTTDLTLIELSDFNRPLLKELSQKAPGTFHHSVNLGTLAEAAAEAIGANAILARIGAYYHDVGKLMKPALFVENQLGTVNRHERLNPRTSAKIVADHVKDGEALARSHGLPEIVVDFIPMHHGTTMIGFFYDEAVRKQKSGEPVSEDDFRYPGPRPQTKETGIVMLADAVEAATRTIDLPTIQKIEERIDSIIKLRFLEGELDDCELTLRDLSKIKASFVKILTGILHARLRYPEPESPEEMLDAVTPAEPAITPAALPVKKRRPRKKST